MDKKKKLTKKQMIFVSIPLVLIIILVLGVKIKYSFFNNVRESFTKSNYTCETGFRLIGTKCISNVKKQSVLLGNVNLDNEINERDIELLSELITTSSFDDNSYSASDINQNGIVDETDLLLLEEYVSNNKNDYDIGIRRVCPMDKENISNYLSENQCIQIISKDASKKGESNPNLEGTSFSTNYNTETYIDTGISTYVEPEYTTFSRNFSYFYNPADENIEKQENEIELETGPNTQTDINTSYQTISPVQPHQYVDTSQSNNSYSGEVSTHGYKIPYSYDTTYYDSIYYDTNNFGLNTYYDTEYFTSNPSLVDEKIDNSKGRVLYANGSLIKIDEVKAPKLDKEYQYKDKIKIELNAHQQGTGLYYYTLNQYSSTNSFNGGYLNSQTTCRRLKTNKNISYEMDLNSNDKHLELNVYADRNCRSQKIVAKYISGNYKVKTNFKETKTEEKTIKIDDDVVITMVSPFKTDIGLYEYRIKYSISNEKKYYVIWNEYKNNNVSVKGECTLVKNGMNQVYSLLNPSKDRDGEITLYEDSKCNNSIKSIKSITH